MPASRTGISDSRPIVVVVDDGGAITGALTGMIVSGAAIVPDISVGADDITDWRRPPHGSVGAFMLEQIDAVITVDVARAAAEVRLPRERPKRDWEQRQAPRHRKRRRKKSR